MNIKQQNGIVSTIIFSPFFETEEHNKLRKSLFDQAQIGSVCAPTSRSDAFDESILIFEGYEEALDFLVNMFRSASTMQNRSNVNISLKSSICRGNFFIHQGQIYGEAVNLATRLCFTSRENELQICGIDNRIVRNFLDNQDDITCFIREQDDNCISLGLRDLEITQTRTGKPIIRVEHQGQLMDYKKSRHLEISIGRSDTSDIFIEGDHISRSHATIIIKDDILEIKDHSSNGTYLYFDGREIFLTEDSVILNYDGFISCGVPRQTDAKSADVISYRYL